MRIATITTLLADTDVADFDAVVVVCGASDAVQLLPPHKWDTAIEKLIGTLVQATPEPTNIIIVGIQLPSTVPVFHLAEGGAVDQQADLFNTITRQYCTGRVSFLAPPYLTKVGPQRGTPVDQHQRRATRLRWVPGLGRDHRGRVRGRPTPEPRDADLTR